MNEEELIQHLQEMGQQNNPAPAYLASRILTNLPVRDPLQQLFEWFSQAAWRSATAIATPLMIGFALGISDATNYLADASQQDTQWFDSQDLVYADVLEEYSYDEL